MSGKMVKLLVPVALIAALLLTSCSFRSDDTASGDDMSAVESDVVSDRPSSSPTPSAPAGNTYSDVVSEGAGVLSDVMSEIYPDNNASSGVPSRETSR